MGYDHRFWTDEMINKLYKLKQQQINQQVLLKQQALSKIDDLDRELYSTNHALHSASVDIMGAISDFRVLQIHKDTMKDHMIKLAQKKAELKKKVDYYDKIIVELNKESEQFNYILQEEKKAKAKELIKQEELVTAEYVQAQFIKESKKYVS